jgi:methionyl-tRNA formyltransferase
MRVIVMGRRPQGAAALEYLAERGHSIAAVIASHDDPSADPVRRFAERYGVPCIDDKSLYEQLAQPQRPPYLLEIDLVISYCHRRLIRPSIIALPRIGCFNFHPAPLPDFRGLGGSNFAILEGLPEFGVSVHWVSPEFDTGDIVKVRRFAMEAEDTALSLSQRSHEHMLQMFRDFIALVESDRAIPRMVQRPESGRYFTRKDMEQAMRVQESDTDELLDRRARAFWYPPYNGAYIERSGRRFTIIPESVLSRWSANNERRSSLP